MAKNVLNKNPYSETLFKKFLHQYLIWIMILLGAFAAYLQTKEVGVFFGALLVIFALFVLFKFFRLSTSLEKNERGADAEVAVGKLLSQLPDKYTVFKNVLVKEGLDVDFVLVGPSGVYAIEVKSHKGFNGYRLKHFIGQTFAEAMSLKEYLESAGLKTYVKGVLVFSRANFRYSGPNGKRSSVAILNKEDLLHYIDHAPLVNYNQRRVEEIIQQLYQ